jgi:hypothetical protein
MKPERLGSFPNLPHLKRSFLLGPGEQILDQIETICSQQDKFGNDTKTFWFHFQNDIGIFFLLSFLTLFTSKDVPLPLAPHPSSLNYHKLTREREGVEPIPTTAKKRGPLPYIRIPPQANDLRKMVRELLKHKIIKRKNGK